MLKLLKKIRVLLSLIILVLITSLFLDLSGFMGKWFNWLAKLQLVPSILAVNIASLAIVLTATLVFGRVYCSFLCPLGCMQDIISHLASRRKKFRFTYRREIPLMRFIFFGVFLLLLFFGLTSFAGILDPYSAYGRIISNLVSPIYFLVNTLLDKVAFNFNSYLFQPFEPRATSIVTIALALTTLLVLGATSWVSGRLFCNTVCPVGTLLGYLSRFALLKPLVDHSKCNNCSLCTKNCKASCIDPQDQRIDYSRCVSCFNCIDSCNKEAITFGLTLPFKRKTKAIQDIEPKNQTKIGGITRKGLLTVSSLLIGGLTIKAQEEQIEGALAKIQDKKIAKRVTPLKPAGSQGLRQFSDACTACQLCVANCPHQVLRPSKNILTLMQPEMSFEKGYCRPECTTCSTVCPNGAIGKITVANKSSTQIGHAVWVEENCVVNSAGINCGNCARHCPSGAISMVPLENKKTKPDESSLLRSTATPLQIPVVHTQRCIGCGACEYLCPARPLTAIYVEGHERHKLI